MIATPGAKAFDLLSCVCKGEEAGPSSERRQISQHRSSCPGEDHPGQVANAKHGSKEFAMTLRNGRAG